MSPFALNMMKQTESAKDYQDFEISVRENKI